MADEPAPGSRRDQDPVGHGTPDGTPPAGNHPAGNHPAGNHPAGNHPAGNHPGGNQPGGNQPGGNQPGGNQPGGNQPGGQGSGGQGAGKSPGGSGPGARRARKLARGFAEGGPLDQAFPGPALTRVLDRASGPARRCEGAGDDEASGMLGRWEATKAWSASAKPGVIRELIRRRALPGYEASGPGELPGAWQEGLTQEVSNQLGVSLRAADALTGLAADLDTRLVLTGEALAAGVISLAKAKIIREAAAVLDDRHAAVAGTLIADQLAGKTPGQVAALIARAVVRVDPEGAVRRREQAQREEARVRFWREHAGTAALAAFGLPPDEALAANQHIQDRWKVTQPRPGYHQWTTPSGRTYTTEPIRYPI